MTVETRKSKLKIYFSELARMLRWCVYVSRDCDDYLERLVIIEGME